MTAPGGRRWQAFRLLVFGTYGRTCHICGHPGSNQVDHLIPQAVAPHLAWVLSNCRPAHGVPGNKCPTCGLACNQSRQAGIVKPISAKPAALNGKQPDVIVDVDGMIERFPQGRRCEGLAGGCKQPHGHPAGSPARCW
jgi:hypothetical protein